MRLNNLKLTNFTSYKEELLLFPPGKIFLFGGMNGAGKSSIIDSLEYLLTGKVKSFKKSNAAHYLTNRGEVDMGVTGVIEHWDKVEEFSRIADKCSKKQSTIFNFLGTTEKVLDAVFNIGRFMAMGEDKRRELVSSLGGVEITDNDLDMQGITDQDVRQIVKDLSIKKAIDYCEEMRRGKQRRLQGYREAPVPSEPTVIEVEVKGEVTKVDLLDSEFMTKAGVHLAVLQRRRDDAIQEHGRNEQILAKAGSDEERDEVSRQVLSLAEQVKDAREREKEHAGIDKKISKKQEDQVKARTLHGQTEETIREIKKHGLSCPYGAETVCTADSEKILSFLEGKKESQAKTVKAAQTALKKLQGQKAKISPANIASLEQLLSTARIREKEMDEAFRLCCAGAAGENENEIAGHKAEINAWGEVVSAGKRVKANQELLAVREGQINELERAIEEMKATEGKLKDGELEKKLSGEPEKVLLKIAEEFRTIGIPFQVNDLYNTKKEMTLSTSERYRLGIVYRAALSALAGLGILIIDDFEILDEGNKRALMDIVGKTIERWDQVIILGTQVEEKMPASTGPDGFTTYYVESGFKADKIKKL